MIKNPDIQVDLIGTKKEGVGIFIISNWNVLYPCKTCNRETLMARNFEHSLEAYVCTVIECRVHWRLLPCKIQLDGLF